jgi:hypothetical protein
MTVLKVPVSSSDHIQGDERASVTLLEYGDYECPHCGLAHHIVKSLQKHYGRELRFVFRNFPLIEIHPMAEPAAEAAEFANLHDQFWAMHDGIYENQDRLAPPVLFELGEELKLPPLGLRSATTMLRRSAVISWAACVVASMVPRRFSSTTSGTTDRTISRPSSRTSTDG